MVLASSPLSPDAVGPPAYSSESTGHEPPIMRRAPIRKRRALFQDHGEESESESVVELSTVLLKKRAVATPRLTLSPTRPLPLSPRAQPHAILCLPTVPAAPGSEARKRLKRRLSEMMPTTEELANAPHMIAPSPLRISLDAWSSATGETRARLTLTAAGDASLSMHHHR